MPSANSIWFEPDPASQTYLVAINRLPTCSYWIFTLIAVTVAICLPFADRFPRRTVRRLFKQYNG